jgi:CHAT domain-containing protein
MTKKTTLIVLLFSIFTSISFAQNLPLKLFWNGKTNEAIALSKKILLNKNTYSNQELSSSYDFLAEYNIDQGHYEAFLKFVNLDFKTNHRTAFDSAFFYARIANYYHCYINPDSSLYFFLKAKDCFSKATLNLTDSNSIARYYGYLGNASRNLRYRNVSLLDSANLFAKTAFTQAVNHRKYATFLIDEISNFTNKKGKKLKFKQDYSNCISHLKLAEKKASEIFKNKKSDLHSRIFNLWALAERLNSNISISHKLTKMARSSLIDNKIVLNPFEYAASLNADASLKLSQYREKKNRIKLVYEAEKLLKISIPYWEKFLKKELYFSKKNFDDRYSLNPYNKLTIVYYELYKFTKNINYLYKIQGLSEIIKFTDITSNKKALLNDSLNKELSKKIQNLCSKNNYAIINFIGSNNPNNLIAIVSIPDTTLIISCSENEFTKHITFDYSIKDIVTDPLKNKLLINILKEAYHLCFQNINAVLEKKKINKVHIITHGLISGINFDLAITDSISKNLLIESTLINKYNFMYHSNAYSLLHAKNNIAIYKGVEILAPNYKNTKFPEIIFGKTLPEKIKSLFQINISFNNNNHVFFQNNELIQFIGHINSHEFSNQQYLILNDTDEIKSDDILQHNLSGSSYLLNGCASNVGKYEMNNRINNLPSYLISRNAIAVISTLWPIDDKENTEFLEQFYHYLSEGMISSEALRKTKLYFAKRNYPPSMWGAYLYYGNDFYLLKKETSYLYLVLGIGMLFMIVAIRVISKRK